MTDDPVREFLTDRGCSPQTIEGGIEGLIDAWEQTVSEVGKGYALTLDDYLNDLDARQLIADILTFFGDKLPAGYVERIATADLRMQENIDIQPVCLWSDTVAEMEGWNPEDNWWYYARPRNADQSLLDEIDSAE
ncbi:MAG: hypothetical protein AB7H86_10130 [Blastocatellales bacterium]